MLTKMGYDEHLYSLKSKVFILSIHSELKIKASVKDAVGSQMDERAKDMLLEHYARNIGAGPGSSQSDDCVIVIGNHDLCGAKTIGAINKLDHPIKVTLDMTKSKLVHMTPSSGVVTKIIPANQIRYLCSIVIEPETQGASFRYTFVSEPLHGEPQAEEQSFE